MNPHTLARHFLSPVAMPNENTRHRVVQALSRKILEEETKKLLKEGWRVIGEPALATPVDLNRPPYWVQAVYLSPTEIPLESQVHKTPSGSMFSDAPKVEKPS